MPATQKVTPIFLGDCPAIAVIDAAKSAKHLMTHLGRLSLRAGSLLGARLYLGEEGRRIARFTLPVCKDSHQIAFHAAASDVIPAHVVCALVHGDTGHQLERLVLAHGKRPFLHVLDAAGVVGEATSLRYSGYRNGKTTSARSRLLGT